MPSVHVLFEFTTHWAADIDYGELRELSSDACKESWEQRPGYFKCPPEEGTDLVEPWCIPKEQLPTTALSERLFELGWYNETGPVGIVSVELSDGPDGD
jgi:hypothetical protein